MDYLSFVRLSYKQIYIIVEVRRNVAKHKGWIAVS